MNPVKLNKGDIVRLPTSKAAMDSLAAMRIGSINAGKKVVITQTAEVGTSFVFHSNARDFKPKLAREFHISASHFKNLFPVYKI